MLTAPDLLDVVVIGGGPAGLSAALVLARANRRVAIIDAGEPRNRQARELHDFLGRDGCSPQELLAAGRRDVGRYGVEILTEQVVELLERGAAGRTEFLVKTRSGRGVAARKILFATGLKDELPSWPGFSECYGLSVHHCPYCDAFEYRGRTIAACANDPAQALGLAMSLLTWSPHVVVLTDGDDLGQDHETHSRLMKYKLPWQAGRIERLCHDGGRLVRVQLEDGDSLECVALFFSKPQSPCCDLPRLFGCRPELVDGEPTNRKQQTSIPGIYLAGDADGDVKFAIVAAAEGAKAAVAINRELQDESLQQPTSTRSSDPAPIQK